MKRLLLVACVACGKSESPPPPPPATLAPGVVPTCSEVADHMLQLQLVAAGIDLADDAAVAGARYGLRTRIEQVKASCEQKRWSPAERRCMAMIAPTKNAAAASAAFAACDRAAMIERGEDMGGPPCEQVADHMRDVLGNPASARPAMIEKCANLNRGTKECLLRAKDQAAFIACGTADDAR